MKKLSIFCSSLFIITINNNYPYHMHGVQCAATGIYNPITPFIYLLFDGLGMLEHKMKMFFLSSGMLRRHQRQSTSSSSSWLFKIHNIRLAFWCKLTWNRVECALCTGHKTDFFWTNWTQITSACIYNTNNCKKQKKKKTAKRRKTRNEMYDSRWSVKPTYSKKSTYSSMIFNIFFTSFD